MTVRQLVREALTLPPRSRAELADQIIASLELEAELRREWREELKELEEEFEWWEVEGLHELDDDELDEDELDDDELDDIQTAGGAFA